MQRTHAAFIGCINRRLVVEQHLGKLDLSVYRRRVQGGPARLVLGIHIRAATEQPQPNFQVPLSRRAMQRSLVPDTPNIYIREMFD